MGRSDYKINVLINSSLPDYRLFVDFLWDYDHNVDSDGDSYNPASRSWAFLDMESRENENERFSIDQAQDNPLIYIVKSENQIIANRVAYFLMKETDGDIYFNDKNYKFDFYKDKLGNDFDLLKALQRSDKSIWRQSSLENPYPNRQEKK
ncbi:hypothetical protein [Flavobacterium sp. FlaQc-48]|uniref:hypothetical protein n=1 Tax=Flavobacterium sp. FlaQc-48 TaxID=3374181 RepID=UPI0037576E75